MENCSDAVDNFVAANREGLGDQGLDVTLRDAAAEPERLAPHVARWDQGLVAGALGGLGTAAEAVQPPQGTA